MSHVQLISGELISLKLFNIRHVGEEGGRSADAYLDGRKIHVYQNDVDGPTDVWDEQAPGFDAFEDEVYYDD